MVDKFDNFKKPTPEEQEEIKKQVKIVKDTIKTIKKLPITEDELTVNFTDKPRFNKNDY